MYPDETLYCPACDAERAVEIPECVDGVPADWPERACIECGAALFVDPLIRTQPSRHRAA
jgi:hypothetical protein